MATNTIEIGILGMGRIGASLGLALKRYNTGKNVPQQFRVTVYDTSESRLSAAKSLGAFDVQTRSIHDAIRDKALIVLAIPYADASAAYREIGSAARPGQVIMDLSPLKSPSLEWAKKYLPAEVFMIGAAPILNPSYLFDSLDETENARADLFDKGGMLIMPTVNSIPDAVELVTDLCGLIHAPTRFADPLEYDTWAAATEGMPMAVGLAAMYALLRSESWIEAQKAANHHFGRLIHHLIDTHPDDMRDTLIHNRESLVRQLDGLISALGGLRDGLAQNNKSMIEAIITETSDAANEWSSKRRDGKWEKAEAPPHIDAGSITGNLLLGGALTRRIRGDKRDKR